MATVNANTLCSRRFWHVWALILLSSLQTVHSYAPTIPVNCLAVIDILNWKVDAGLLISNLPDRIPIYPEPDKRCDIHISIPPNYEMMFYFDFLDIYTGDRTKCDTTSIELFDGAPGVHVTGLQRPVCGRYEDMPRDMFFVFKNFLIIRVNAISTIMGAGFRIHFTIYRKSIPCNSDEFTCWTFGSPRCIRNNLVCDEWNDCGDWVDEQQRCDDITAIGIVAVIIGVLVIFGVAIFVVICCMRNNKRYEKLMITEKAESGIMHASFDSRNGRPESAYTVSMDSVNTKDSYVPRYTTYRNSKREKLASFGPEEDAPPRYTEKPLHNEISFDSRVSGDPTQDDRRSRRASKEKKEESLEEEDDAPRLRRSNSRRKDKSLPDNSFKDEKNTSQENRPPSRREDPDASRDKNSRPRPDGERYPSEDDEPFPPPPEELDESDAPRDERYPPRDDRYPSRDDRYPSRDDRYPSRDDRYPSRDDRYPSRDDRYPSRDDRYPSRDDRQLPRDDRYPARDDRRLPRDERYDDKAPRAEPYSRREDRRPRDDERPPSRREERRPRPSSGRYDARNSMDRESDSDTDANSYRDSLHPLRRSVHMSSESDVASRKSDKLPYSPPQDKNEDRYPAREAGRQASRDSSTPYDSSRNRDKAPSARDERPVSRGDRAAAPARREPEESFDSEQDDPSRGRRTRPTAREPTPPVPVPSTPSGSDIPPDDTPPRRRRRSRSREGQGRSRSIPREEPTEDRRSRASIPSSTPAKEKAPPVAVKDLYEDEPFRPRGKSYKEEAV